MPEATRVSTRRTLLTQSIIGATALAAPAAAIADTPEPDPHLAWRAEAERINAEAEQACQDDDVQDDYYWQMDELLELIANTPAATPAGIAVQVQTALDCHEEGSCLGDTEAAALRNAIASLQRIGGRVAA